jgi:hypothetical protein
VMTETLATSLAGDRTPGASDAVEPEAVEGPGGAVQADGQFDDQIIVGEHHVRITLRLNPAPVA